MGAANTGLVVADNKDRSEVTISNTEKEEEEEEANRIVVSFSAETLYLCYQWLSYRMWWRYWSAWWMGGFRFAGASTMTLRKFSSTEMGRSRRCRIDLLFWSEYKYAWLKNTCFPFCYSHTTSVRKSRSIFFSFFWLWWGDEQAVCHYVTQIFLYKSYTTNSFFTWGTVYTSVLLVRSPLFYVLPSLYISCRKIN